ncbi:MAG: HTTM domain-containing protein [Myxococcales bacterium]
MTAALLALRRQLARPVDPAGFVAFRVGFGLLASFAALRFVALGWVQELLLAPRFHFAWLPGLEVPSAPVLYGLFAAQALAGLGIALGRWPRLWLLVWLGAFGYVELLDKALYLNHYVLLTLLGLWLLVSPVHRVGLRDGSALPAWSLLLLRVQIATVYTWAGLAKLNSDWLLRAEPLRTWLQARVDVPLLGPLLAHDGTAFAMAWAGAAYDLSIPWLLMHRRTRALGFALVAGFHCAVGLIFPIGIFPAAMILGATLFFDPAWPRRVLALPPGPGLRSRAPVAPAPALAFVAVVAALALFPARFVLWGTQPSWSEHGHRFAWRVLLNEKTGLVDFRVVDGNTGRRYRVLPGRELTRLQHEQMRTQPDMIRDYALHLAERFGSEGGLVAVYADAWASLNGRPAQRLLRADVDLTRPLPELQAAGWILPMASDPTRFARRSTR